MRLKTYTAATIAQAMAQVRDELGEEAIIISTETAKRDRSVRVVAAIDETAPNKTAFSDWIPDQPSEPAAPENEVDLALAYHGVPAALAQRLGRAAAMLPEREMTAALAAALEGTLSFQPMENRLTPRPLMLVGPPGVGKTTVAAKLIVAAHRRRRKVLAVTCDAARAGGVEQLEAFTRILGLPLQTADTPEALARVLEAADDANVIIDSAGVNPLSMSDMRALQALVEQARAEPLLVLAAGADALESGELAAGFASVGCRRMVATRLDVARRVGALLNAADAGRLSFAGFTDGPHAADAVGPLGALALARLLLSPMTKRASASKPREVPR